jgi:hypothetical protein
MKALLRGVALVALALLTVHQAPAQQPPTVRIVFTGLTVIDYKPGDRAFHVWIPDFGDVPSPGAREHRAYVRVLRKNLLHCHRLCFTFTAPNNEIYSWVGLWKDVLSDDAPSGTLTVPKLDGYYMSFGELVKKPDLKTLTWSADYSFTKGTVEPICIPGETYQWTFANTPTGSLTRCLMQGVAITFQLTSPAFNLKANRKPFVDMTVSGGEILEITIGNSLPEDVELRGKLMTKDPHFARYYELLQTTPGNKPEPQRGNDCDCPPKGEAAQGVVLAAPKGGVLTLHGANCPPIRK